MPDPYEPQSFRTASEVRSPKDDFLLRLAELGATPEEVTQVDEDWDHLDPDDCAEPDCWTAAERDRMLLAGDFEIADMLTRARAEYETGTNDEDQQAALDADRAVDAVLAEAGERIGGTVGAVTGWVGDDVAKARAVLDLETSSDHPRKGIVEPLTALLAAEADLDPVEALLAAAGIPEAEVAGWADDLYEARDALVVVTAGDADHALAAILAAIRGEPEDIAAYGVAIELPDSDLTSTDKVRVIAGRIFDAVDAQTGPVPSVGVEGDDTPSDAPEGKSGDESPAPGEA